ncbi:hypothetical protein SB57_10770, partial [Lactobacillus delbrueckii subsp. bulgaricus]
NLRIVDRCSFLHDKILLRNTILMIFFLQKIKKGSQNANMGTISAWSRPGRGLSLGRADAGPEDEAARQREKQPDGTVTIVIQ